MLFQKYCITSLHYEWQIVTTISNFYSKINKKCLATGLSPNPAGELRALPPKKRIWIYERHLPITCQLLADRTATM